MNYKPLGDTVLIKLDPVVEEEVSPGGIVIVNEVEKHVRQKGKESGIVVDIGNLVDKKTSGFKTGDRVCFKRYSGCYLEDAESDLRLLNEADILAVIID
jgi:co-chaperonin GroES (HSP10)